MPVYPMNPETACMIVFARAPIQGQVKTRLEKNLDASLIVELYRNFVTDIIDKITSTGQCLKIFYDPEGSEPLMREWLGSGHDFVLQSGSDLGQKMANAFGRIFDMGFRSAVLMGTDFPDLPKRILTDALSELRVHDAVIGPTADGGYYLIGFNADSFLPDVFQNLPWGTPAVYQKTMQIFAASGTSVQQLPAWRDIDVYDDLKDLIHSLKHHPDQALHTYLFLKQAGMIP